MMCDRPNNNKFKRFHLKNYPYCNNCNLKVSKATCILDHIQRLVEGGPDVIGNTQLLCLSCDNLKTVLENKRDELSKIINIAQSLKDHIGAMDNLFKENTRKTKRERSKYNKYLKALEEWNTK